MQQDVVDLLECPNCSTPLSRRSCPQCGQKVSDVNPTIHDLLHVLVPLSALLVQAVTWRTGRNYPQHLSFALRIHAAFFALLTATMVLELLNVTWLNAATSIVGTMMLAAYTVAAFRRAYGGTWPVAVGRTAFVLTCYAIVIAAAAVLLILFTAHELI